MMAAVGQSSRTLLQQSDLLNKVREDAVAVAKAINDKAGSSKPPLFRLIGFRAPAASHLWCDLL